MFAQSMRYFEYNTYKHQCGSHEKLELYVKERDMEQKEKTKRLCQM